MLELWLWRHPRPCGVAGRCIGQTDVVVHWRRAKRLAHRVREQARRHQLPHVVWTSPLQRCAAVGHWLARWGWLHHIETDLLELDFGSWDGQPWANIPHSAVAAWEADFLQHAPGGGEALVALLARCQAFINARAAQPGPAVLLVVAHAGWINACAVLGQAASQQAAGDQTMFTASTWPAAPRYGSLSVRPVSQQARTVHTPHLGARATHT